jgi:hypothetical protein
LPLEQLTAAAGRGHLKRHEKSKNVGGKKQSCPLDHGFTLTASLYVAMYRLPFRWLFRRRRNNGTTSKKVQKQLATSVMS